MINRYSKALWLASIHLVIICIFIVLHVSNLFRQIFVISVYIILILFIKTFITNRKGYLKEDFRKELTNFVYVLIFALIFIIGGFTLIESANKTTLNLPFNEYEFEIKFPQNQENIVINNFNVYFDFDKQKGSIYFIIVKLNKSNQVSQIQVSLPPTTKVDTFTIHNRTGWKLINKTFYNTTFISNKHKTFVAFYEIKSDLEGTRINISFNGSLIPNGKFRLYSYAKKTYSVGRNTISFNLGKYYCQNYCFGDLLSSEIELNNQLLKVSYPQDYYGNDGNINRTLQQKVTLNTFDSELEREKQIGTSLAIAILMAGIISLAEGIRRYALLLMYK